MSHLNQVTDSSFETDVIQSDVPVLVDFWASWCRPCQMLTPILEEIAPEHTDTLKIVKMNVEENSDIPAKYGIRGIPALLLFKNGKLVATKVGYVSKPQLTEFLNSQLATA